MNLKKCRKKMLTTALACTTAFTSAAILPMQTAAADDASYIFHDTFESGDGGWGSRGGCSAKTDSTMPYADNSALYVSGRTDTWHGAQKDISSVCEAGKTYSFSVCVCTGPEVSASQVTYQLSLAYKDGSGGEVYDHLAKADVLTGPYAQLANAEYTIPSGASDPILYVETVSGSGSFYIDEAICAAAGTQIEGPKEVKFQLGDINMDGVISAADLTLAKRHLGKDFPNKMMLKAADVNQNTLFSEEEVDWFVQYLTGQTSVYPEKVAPPEPEVKPFDYNANLQYHPFNESVYLSQASHPGKVVEEHYNGPKGQNTLYVYLPPDYDENKKYNIFYLMHGGGENEKTLFFQNDTMMQNIMDHMIENGEIEPMILVTPTFNQSEAEGFWSEFRDRVVPFVEGKYSTYAESTSLEDLQASRYHRAYGGFSMGSVSTWAVFTHCLDIVAYYMPLSGDHWGGTNTSYDKAKAIADAVDKAGLQKDEFFIMAATGTTDIAYPNIGPQIEEMKKMSQFVYTSDLSKGNLYFIVAEGKDHWWGNVRHYVYDMLPYFFHEHQTD